MRKIKEEGSEARERFPNPPPPLSPTLSPTLCFAFFPLPLYPSSGEKERERERERENPPEALDSPPHFSLLVSIELTQCSLLTLRIYVVLSEILIPPGFMLVFK